MKASRALLCPLFALLACAVLFPVAASAQFSKVLVPKASTWKYSPNFADLGVAWRAVDYDDSSWPMGPAPIGYGESGLGTSMASPPNPKPITFYMRRTFTVSVSDRSQIQGMFLSVRRDDGAVVYLNGTEIGRSNMPAGTIVNGTPAVSSVGGADETRFFDIAVGPTLTSSLLKSGNNVIAMEIHQSDTGSSDTQGDLQLVGSEVDVNFGTVFPGRAINFEDAAIYGFLATNFVRDPFLGHTDYNWSCTPLVLPAIAGADFQVETSSDLFDLSGWQWVVGGGNSVLRSENIDTRNYRDVKVIFGIRSVAETGGFEAGDSLKVGARTSASGVSFDGDVVAANFTGGAQSSGESILVAASAPKKARVPNSDAESTANPNWRQVGFNDAGWTLSGTNGVGYERSTGNAVNYTGLIGAGLDTNAAMYTITATCYLRVPFTAPAPSTLQTLQLLMKYDDGFVAYINGTEVARRNAPAGIPAFNAEATATRADNLAVVFETINITSMKNLLVAGSNNLLAIHCLNTPASSSDFVVLPELRATTVGGSVPNFPPTNLNDLRGDFMGSFFYYEAAIPDAVESIQLYADAKVNETSEYLFVDGIRVTGTPLSVDSFATWIQLETELDPGEDEGQPEGNPDGDPFTNLMEYAVGGDAESASMVSAISGLPLSPQFEIVEDNGLRFMEMEFRILDLTVSGTLNQPIGGYTVRDLKYIPQISEDGLLTPASWDDGANGNTVATLVGDFVENGDGTLTVRVRFTTPISEGTRQLFFRLLVEQVLN